MVILQLHNFVMVNNAWPKSIQYDSCSISRRVSMSIEMGTNSWNILYKSLELIANSLEWINRLVVSSWMINSLFDIGCFVIFWLILFNHSCTFCCESVLLLIFVQPGGSIRTIYFVMINVSVNFLMIHNYYTVSFVFPCACDLRKRTKVFSRKMWWFFWLDVKYLFDLNQTSIIWRVSDVRVYYVSFTNLT